MNFFSNFFEDIVSIFTPKRVLGIDIGTVSMKLVEVVKKGTKLVLDNYGILETQKYLLRGNEAIQTGSLKIVEKDAIKFLQTLLAEVNPKTKNAIVSLPAFSSFIVPLELPMLSPRETAEALRFQARQYIPIPVNELALDWVKIEDFQNTRGEKWQRILLIGVPKELIVKYQKIFAGCGLRLVALEVESLSLNRALFYDIGNNSMAVDIGAESTNVIVSESGALKYASQIDYGGVSLTQAIARSLDISALRAEELKKRRGLLTFGGEAELSTLILPFLDVIINEVRRAQGVYENRYLKRVDQIILSGAGANMLGISDYFKNQLGKPIANPSALARFGYSSSLQPIAKELNNTLPIALGLAEKYFGA